MRCWCLIDVGREGCASSSQSILRRDRSPDLRLLIVPSGSRSLGSGHVGKKFSLSLSPTRSFAGIAGGFRLYWQSISKRGPGRPRISDEVRALIRRFALENGWGARKVHAELGKLGFAVSLATVSRYLPKRPPDRGKQQRWGTFLQNHKDGVTAMDFFVVPTARFRLLYVWFLIDHGRRRIIHFNVTTNPTAQGVIQQLRESFPANWAPRYLIFDNDTIFSDDVSLSIRAIHINIK